MSPDPSAHLVALLLKKLTGRRWVAEFRDPWMSNPFRHPRPFRWMERFESWLEEKVVLGCDHICVTSAEYRDDFLQRYPALNSGKISFIPNGFDPTDFEGLVPEKFDRFTIMHAGNFYGARSAGLFLTAYGGMLARRPDLRERTQAVFVGSIDKAAMDKLGGSLMKQNVVLMGNRSHRESLSLTCGADILLLIPGPGSGTMPGKTYEYLRAGRPVYCLGAAGPAADLIRRTGAGVVEAATDSTIISLSLERLVDRVAQDPMVCTCVPAVLNQYNRREIAGKIAAVLAGQS